MQPDIPLARFIIKHVLKKEYDIKAIGSGILIILIPIISYLHQLSRTHDVILISKNNKIFRIPLNSNIIRNSTELFVFGEFFEEILNKYLTIILDEI